MARALRKSSMRCPTHKPQLESVTFWLCNYPQDGAALVVSIPYLTIPLLQRKYSCFREVGESRNLKDVFGMFRENGRRLTWTNERRPNNGACHRGSSTLLKDSLINQTLMVVHFGEIFMVRTVPHHNSLLSGWVSFGWVLPRKLSIRRDQTIPSIFSNRNHSFLGVV